jgi:hypothetical protein
MRMRITGRWRIVDMEVWDQEAVDLLGPAFIELRDGDQGQPSGPRVLVGGQR